jgi:hypothetical protein
LAFNGWIFERLAVRIPSPLKKLNLTTGICAFCFLACVSIAAIG